MVPPPAPGQFENAPEGSRLGPPARGIGGGPGGAGSTGGLGARGTSGESGMNFAERMMAKMGHKEGQGESCLPLYKSMLDLIKGSFLSPPSREGHLWTLPTNSKPMQKLSLLYREEECPELVIHLL